MVAAQIRGSADMKPVAFGYHRPETIAEAVALLAEMREEASVLAGGMSLGPMLNMRLVRPRAVVDVSRIDALKEIALRADVVVTGAGVVQRDALHSPLIASELPLLSMALPWVGHYQTRNRGTLGGSVAHADPSAEIPLCLVVCDGAIVLRSRRRERRVKAREFFQAALTTQRQPDEMLVALEWPRIAKDVGCAFDEIAQRRGDFALASAACCVRLAPNGCVAEISLGLGGVVNRPIAIDTEKFKNIQADTVAPALADHAAGSVIPMEDRVATSEYRLALVRVLVERVAGMAIAHARQRVRATS
jgi:2-furoyl-CoA dehydrogenase FAD binding subunit